MKSKEKELFFTDALLQWNRLQNKRKMPWKGEKDPYKIWLSEVILQQTRVEQGLSYYNAFISSYPTVEELALAKENEVFKLWEGLGYYSRCRNLLASARYIAFDLGGIFPSTYDEILALKGVGPYTAAAIASFAFDLPHAVTDGNVFRVLSRFFGIETAIDSTEGKKFFAKLADELLDKKSPGKYNQALMDFGAVICKPQLPLCNQCPLRPNCTAFKKNMIGTLPVKAKKLTRKKRFFLYIIAEFEDRIYVRQRTGKDIWKGLWEFIAAEGTEKMPVLKEAGILRPGDRVMNESERFKQQLTHRDVEAVFVRVKLKSPLETASYTALTKKEWSRLAFPRIINDYLESA